MAHMMKIVGAVAAPIGMAPFWTQTLFGCFDDGTICMEELFCVYCHLGFMHNYMETRTQQMNFLVCCAACLCDVTFTVGTARCCVISGIRSKLMNQYGISQMEEGSCESCLKSYLCSCCAMCQMHREMHSRFDYIGGVCYKPPVAGQVMGAVQGMVLRR